MKLTYSFDKYLIVINDLLTKEAFLELAGAGKGYSQSLFIRIYDCIFSELVNVEEEYNKYYSIEYENLWLFLFKKYNIKIENIEEIREEKGRNSRNTLFRKENSHLWLEYFMFSEAMYERIINILLMETHKNEN